MKKLGRGVVMSQVLLLTNNPLNESPIEMQLRQLGHEVFTTKVLIDKLRCDEMPCDFFKAFHCVILSETISNSDVKDLVMDLSIYSIPIFRKSDEKLDELQAEDWQQFAITDWLESRPSMEVLREKLSCSKTDTYSKSINEKRSISSLNLSNSERKLFGILYNEFPKTVTREKISLKMWNRGKSNSTMSQLSVMIKHLKDKLYQQDITGPIIETVWGQGYRLHETVYEQVFFDLEESMAITNPSYS